MYLLSEKNNSYISEVKMNSSIVKYNCKSKYTKMLMYSVCVLLDESELSPPLHLWIDKKKY